MVATGPVLRSERLVLVTCLFILCFSLLDRCVAQEFPPTIRKEYNTSWEVSGLVTDTDSRPLSGVKVYLARSGNYG